MSEEHYLAHRHSCLVDYIDNAQGRVLRRSRPLGDRNFSGPFVVNEKVGEGSTDIDRKPVHRSHPPIRRGQDEPTKGATEMQTDAGHPESLPIKIFKVLRSEPCFRGGTLPSTSWKK